MSFSRKLLSVSLATAMILNLAFNTYSIGANSENEGPVLTVEGRQYICDAGLGDVLGVACGDAVTTNICINDVTYECYPDTDDNFYKFLLSIYHDHFGVERYCVDTEAYNFWKSYYVNLIEEEGSSLIDATRNIENTVKIFNPSWNNCNASSKVTHGSICVNNYVDECYSDTNDSFYQFIHKVYQDHYGVERYCVDETGYRYWKAQYDDFRGMGMSVEESGLKVKQEVEKRDPNWEKCEILPSLDTAINQLSDEENRQFCEKIGEGLAVALGFNCNSVNENSVLSYLDDLNFNNNQDTNTSDEAGTLSFEDKLMICNETPDIASLAGVDCANLENEANVVTDPYTDNSNNNSTDGSNDISIEEQQLICSETPEVAGLAGIDCDNLGSTTQTTTYTDINSETDFNNVPDSIGGSTDISIEEQELICNETPEVAGLAGIDCSSLGQSSDDGAIYIGDEAIVTDYHPDEEGNNNSSYSDNNTGSTGLSYEEQVTICSETPEVAVLADIDCNNLQNDNSSDNTNSTNNSDNSTVNGDVNNNSSNSTNDSSNSNANTGTNINDSGLSYEEQVTICSETPEVAALADIDCNNLSDSNNQTQVDQNNTNTTVNDNSNNPSDNNTGTNINDSGLSYEEQVTICSETPEVAALADIDCNNLSSSNNQTQVDQNDTNTTVEDNSGLSQDEKVMICSESPEVAGMAGVDCNSLNQTGNDNSDQNTGSTYDLSNEEVQMICTESPEIAVFSNLDCSSVSGNNNSNQNLPDQHDLGLTDQEVSVICNDNLDTGAYAGVDCTDHRPELNNGSVDDGLNGNNNGNYNPGDSQSGTNNNYNGDSSNTNGNNGNNSNGAGPGQDENGLVGGYSTSEILADGCNESINRFGYPGLSPLTVNKIVLIGDKLHEKYVTHSLATQYNIFNAVNGELATLYESVESDIEREMVRAMKDTLTCKEMKVNQKNTYIFSNN